MSEQNEEVPTIFVGRKPLMNYALALSAIFKEKTAYRALIKARGRAISRAVDTAEVAMRRYVPDLKVKRIVLGTETLFPAGGGEGKNVSTMEIELERFIPHVQETMDFFQQAGFVVTRRSAYHLIIESTRRDFSRYGKIMVAIATIKIASSGEDIRLFHKDLQETYNADLKGKVAFLVVSSSPVGGAVLQIMAYKWDLGLTIAPVSIQRIADALRSGSCYEVASDTLGTYTGKADLYGITVPIIDPVMFFGRERMIDEALDYIHHGQHIGIFGMRKMGKTSLLHQLKYGLSERKGHPVAYVDLQMVFGDSSNLLKSILTEFLKDIKYKYPDLQTPPSEMDSFNQHPLEIFKRGILRLHRLVSKETPETKFVLILDEIDRLFPRKEMEGIQGYVDFLALIRGLSQQYGFLITVVSGLDSYINKIHDFPTFQFFKELWLSNFEKRDAEKMIVELGGWMGVTYSQKSLQRITEESGRHPFITRMLCSSIYKTLGKRKRVNSKDVTSGLQRYYQEHSDYIEGLWKEFLLSEERDVLRVLSKQEKGGLRDSVALKGKSLTHLEQLHLISREKNAYKIDIKLFQRWIQNRLDGENT